MKNRSIVPFVAGLALLAACGQPEKKAEVKLEPPPTIPMEDFFKNPEKSGFRISPDGQYFA